MILTSMHQVMWCIADSINIMSMCKCANMCNVQSKATHKHCSAHALLMVKIAAKGSKTVATIPMIKMKTDGGKKKYRFHRPKRGKGTY